MKKKSLLSNRGRLTLKTDGKKSKSQSRERRARIGFLLLRSLRGGGGGGGGALENEERKPQDPRKAFRGEGRGKDPPEGSPSRSTLSGKRRRKLRAIRLWGGDRGGGEEEEGNRAAKDKD